MNWIITFIRESVCVQSCGLCKCDRQLIEGYQDEMIIDVQLSASLDGRGGLNANVQLAITVVISDSN